MTAKRIVNQIIDNYYEARAIGHLTDPEGQQPVMPILEACYDASARSVGSQREPVQHRQHRGLSGRCGETGRRVNRTADGHVASRLTVFAFGCLRENIVKFADSCYTYPIDEKEG